MVNDAPGEGRLVEQAGENVRGWSWCVRPHVGSCLERMYEMLPECSARWTLVVPPCLSMANGGAAPSGRARKLTRQLQAATLRLMPGPDELPPPDPAEGGAPADPTTPSLDGSTSAPAPELDLLALPVTGITRRRLAFLAAAFVSAWIVIVFARQVGEASAATTRADGLRAANEQLEAEVDALARELDLIQRQEYFVQQARGYRLGQPEEIPFTLSPDAPPLGADAPGSAAVRLGAESEPQTPLDSWLSLLFGPDQ